jgi:hypothetical protein
MQEYEIKDVSKRLFCLKFVLLIVETLSYSQIERIGFGSYGEVRKILFEGEFSAVKIFKNEAEYYKEVRN